MISWLCNLLAIVAIAIGVGGSIAMGVFQVQDGINTLFNLDNSGLGFTRIIRAIITSIADTVIIIVPLIGIGSVLAIIANVSI